MKTLDYTIASDGITFANSEGEIIYTAKWKPLGPSAHLGVPCMTWINHKGKPQETLGFEALKYAVLGDYYTMLSKEG